MEKLLELLEDKDIEFTVLTSKRSEVKHIESEDINIIYNKDYITYNVFNKSGVIKNQPKSHLFLESLVRILKYN